MPREIVHWHVVTEATKRLHGRGYQALAEACGRFPSLPLLGSIAHDVPYYYRMGEDPFEATADSMHGKDGEDTLDPLRRMIAARSHRLVDDEPLCAFLFGMGSHIGADTQFHPLVFYFTGNYHDPVRTERVAAQGRHRLFETYLDSWMRAQTRFEHGWNIGTLLNEAEETLEAITSLLERTLVPELLFGTPPPPEFERHRWEEGFTAIARFQTLFLSPFMGMVVRFGTLSRNPTLRSIDALFSFRRLMPSPLFDLPLSYRNPVSGASITASAEELLEKSIEETLALAPTFEAILTGRAPAEPFADRVGASLNFGVPHAPASSAVHYAAEGFPLPGLVRTGMKVAAK